MCGIVGLIDQHLAPAAVERQVRQLCAAMVQRGPDGQGEFAAGAIAMGMRRLSIIDLAGGWQPLKSAAGQVIAFQNGEIYNYQALRQELTALGFAFQTDSDTEVLAHGYVQWGIDGLLDRLDGMYALAILDQRSRILHLARDRFGEKPLFFATAPGRLAYSSTLLTIAALPWVDHTIDPAGLDRYLALHYIPGDRTWFKAVQRVLPGERLSIPLDDPIPQHHRYYRPTLAPARRVADVVLADRLEQAVRSRLVADVPVGIFLSGGLDSSTVAAIAAQHSPQINTFSIGFSSAAHDEGPYAQAVATAIGSQHHHFQFDESRFLEFLPQVAAQLDEPIGDQALLPLNWLCQEARQYVTVVLSGEGADELFGGYSYYRPFTRDLTWGQRVQTWLGRSPLPPLPQYATLMRNSVPQTPSGFPLLADGAGRERLLGTFSTEMDAWETELVAWLDQASDPLSRACAADVGTWLVDDLLVKYDRMAMAHSLEGRAPFLQPQLAELGLRLPPSQKMAGGVSKVALRRVAQRWLAPEILNRPKQGFVLPMRGWLQRWFAQFDSVATYLQSRPAVGLDIEVLTQLIEADLERGVQQERLLFAIVLLLEWSASFGDRVAALRAQLMASV